MLEDKLSFRAGESGNKRFSKGDDDYYQFKISGKIAAKGSVMSLLDRNCGKNAVPSFAFYSLFRDCKGLTEAPELPATELADECYDSMFKGCTSLTKAPALPATELAWRCYSSMFNGCTSLIEAPALPATELEQWCYSGMFCLCIGLTKAPALPATELADACYNRMFEGCTSLAEAPALPAMEFVKSCYAWMFSGCTSLNYVKALFTDEPSKESTQNWLRNVSPTGTFVKSKDAKWDVRGDDGIPEGWTVETE